LDRVTVASGCAKSFLIDQDRLTGWLSLAVRIVRKRFPTVRTAKAT
jgi:hypothetical protein